MPLKKMRTLPLLLLLVLALASPLPAQQPASQTPDTDVIRINTNLVQLRVVVTDKSGKLVENLKQDDFAVLENGQPQKITLFSLDRVANEAASLAGNEKPAGGENQSTDPASRPATARSMVLFVDTLNMSAQSLMHAKPQLKRFVDEQITDQDLVALVTTSGSLGVLGQFMRDRVRLKNAIDRLTRPAGIASLYTPYLAAKVLVEAPGALAVAKQIMIAEEGDSLVPPPDSMVSGKAQEILGFAAATRKSTLQLLKAVCERMAEMPGQRMIAFVSDGFTLLDRGGELDHQDFEAATSRATRSGVVIYSFGAQGLTTPVEALAQTPSGLSDFRNADFSNFMSDTRRDQQDTLRFLAADTGGEAFLNSNDLPSQFKKMLDANKVYYAIGYSPVGEQSKKFRSIKVSVKDHADYKLRTQRGYQPVDEKEEKAATTPQERLLRAMLKPLPVTTIPVTSSASFLRRASDEDQLTLQVLLGGGSLEYLKQSPEKYLLKCEIAIVLIDQSGKIANTFAETVSTSMTPAQLESARTRGFRYTRRLDVKPGLYQVRVGARDVNGSAIGTSMSWVEVPKLQTKKLASSSIFIGRETESTSHDAKDAKKPSRTALVVGPALFKKAEPVFYRFVIYNALADSSNELNFKVEILESGKSVYDGPWQPLEPRVVRRDAIGVEIGGQLQMNMDPGLYTFRITVRNSKSRQSTQQTIDLEIGA